MNLKEAIEVSLEFEKKVRDHYLESSEKSKRAEGKRFFAFLGREEEGHVRYLEKMKEKYEKDPKASFEPLPTTPSRSEWLIEGERGLKETVENDSSQGEMERLLVALKLEEEATKMYEKLVSGLNEEGKKLFAPFITIEESHTALVRAEVDYFSRSGYFYDFPEFSLESME